MTRSIRIVVLSFVVALVGAFPAHAAWHETMVSKTTSSSKTSSLVISPSGGTYVAWQRPGADELYWSRRTSTGWRSTKVTGGAFVACYTADNDWVGPSAGFLPDGSAQIASTCDYGGKVLYSRETPSGWKTVTVGHAPQDDSCATSATDVDLITKPSGKPVIFITDQCTHGITGFFRVNGVWETVPVIQGGCCGAFRYGAMALAVDPLTGMIAMVENGDVFGRESLFFAEFDWNGNEITGSTKTIALPNGDAPYGEPSLAFQPNGRAIIAFQEGSAYGTATDSAYAFLALATRAASGTWRTPVTLDDGVQFTGAEPSLSLAGGTMHIAYQDATTFDLRYATSADGSTWNLTTIPVAGATGYFPSLGISTTGIVRVSYDNETDTSLRSVSG